MRSYVIVEKVENLHHHELSSVEREDAIYRLWKTGRYKSHRELGEVLGYHHVTIDALIEAKEFRNRAGFFKDNKISLGRSKLDIESIP